MLETVFMRVGLVLIAPIIWGWQYWYLFLPVVLALGVFKKCRALGILAAALGAIFLCDALICFFFVNIASSGLAYFTAVSALEALIVLAVYMICRFWWSRRKPRAPKCRQPEPDSDSKTEE